MDIKNRIQELMDQRNWTLYRLSKESGVSWSTLKNMFERNTEPTVATLMALCSGLGISLAELLLGEGYTELTSEQKEVLSNLENLNDEDRRLFLELLHSMNQKTAKKD